MKIGFISDVHGNLEALETSLNLLGKESLESIFCAGDIVGYGPNPEECVNIITKNNIKTVMGNHDYAVNDAQFDEYFNTVAREAIIWTREHLSIHATDILKSLPLSTTLEGVTIFHGFLNEKSPFRYILSIADAIDCFKNLNTQIGVFGHSHVAGCFVHKPDGGVEYISGQNSLTLKVSHKFKYLINVGSVGQPRDRNPAGACAILDTDTMIIRILRFNYDIKSVYKKIMERGLSPFLAERLLSGY